MIKKNPRKKSDIYISVEIYALSIPDVSRTFGALQIRFPELGFFFSRIWNETQDIGSHLLTSSELLETLWILLDFHENCQNLGTDPTR